jgi:hypothetical protein
MLEWITPGVGSAMSGFFTAIGAVTALYLAQRFFKGRLSDLKSAISETETSIDKFRLSVEEKLKAFDTSLIMLDAATSALQESASKTQAAVYEAQEVIEEPGVSQIPQADSPKASLRRDWQEIASHFEQIASSKNVDGRTRAKYGRIDRRVYYDLISALASDDLLANVKDSADAATRIWYSNRKRNNVSQQEADSMKKYKDQIMAIPIP